MTRFAEALRGLAGVLAVAAALLGAANPVQAGAQPNPALVAKGHALFEEGCSSCHGFDAHGVAGVAPDLHGVGGRAADFYLTTGRMPFDQDTGEQPLRARQRYSPQQIAAIVAYVQSLGGPPVPTPHPELGDISEGQQAFSDFCAGCHQIMGEGGVVPGAVPPPLKTATATQIAEAVRIGPYVMPPFDEHEIDTHKLDSIILYVQQVVQREPDRGGWGIGHIGPVPEGMVAWLLAGGVLLVVARVIGERMEH